mgnify:CR=1 FL=1
MKYWKCKKKWIAVIALISVMTMNLSMIYETGVKAADYWPSNIDVSSNAAIVMEEQTGAILYSKNMDETHYPASITKIMTALLAIENSDLNETVTFSKVCVNGNEGTSSHISRDVGEEMTMEQCLYGMMLESANECAYAIAEHVGDGDISKFIDMMNAKAKSLGCTNTHFSNPNGLPAEDHYTTAHDMALIARAAYQNKTFATIVGTRSYTIPPTNKHVEETLLNNHHAMLNYYQTNKYLYDYCVGGKTGYTTDANSTLVTYAKKDGMTLICVVMDAASPAHYVDTRNLFDYCFDNFTAYNVASKQSNFTDETRRNVGALAQQIDLITVDENGIMILPKTAEFSDAAVSVEPCSDPSDNDVIGEMKFTYADRYVGGAKIKYSDVSSDSSYPFHNLDEKDGGSSISYLRIDFKMILLILFIIGCMMALVWFFHKKTPEIRLYKHRHFDRVKKEKPKYKLIRRKRKKRQVRQNNSQNETKKDQYRRIKRHK